jgi:hypothetical protein
VLGGVPAVPYSLFRCRCRSRPPGPPPFSSMNSMSALLLSSAACRNLAPSLMLCLLRVDPDLDADNEPSIGTFMSSILIA